MITIDAKGIYYRELNQSIKQVLSDGAQQLMVKNVNGHRYIGNGLSGKQRITIEGTPGNDLAAYMDGLELIVRGNAQDGVGNTISTGTVVVHGDAGDATGYAMRGGELFIRGNVGYRTGIHMKEYRESIPVIVAGGTAGDFFGEYMAGGILIALGLGAENDQEIVGNYCGTGMHGGVIYVRGTVSENKLGKEVRSVGLTQEDHRILEDYITRFAAYFNKDAPVILNSPFQKLIPFDKRPYGNLYTGC